MTRISNAMLIITATMSRRIVASCLAFEQRLKRVDNRIINSPVNIEYIGLTLICMGTLTTTNSMFILCDN